MSDKRKNSKKSLIEIKNQNLSNVPQLSDKNLYWLCKKCGKHIKIWQRRFSILLIEVAKRQMHRKYGFESIYEFAAKLGGMNRNTVMEILRVAYHLRDKPFLWKELQKYGWSKLRVVACIATTETDAFWAEKLSLPKGTLELYIKERRKQEEKNPSENSQNFFSNIKFENQQLILGTNDENVKFLPKIDPENPNNGLLEPKTKWSKFSGEGFSQKKLVKLRFNVDEETEFKLRLFKHNLQKQRKEAVTLGEALKALLDKT